jgi:hypothetical protein
MHNLNRGKKKPKMWATSVIFKIPAQSKQSPIGRKFGQCGHPEGKVHERGEGLGTYKITLLQQFGCPITSPPYIPISRDPYLQSPRWQAEMIPLPR